VAKLASFRIIPAIAAHNDRKVESFRVDFNGAYLNGELGEGEEIYMQQPPGYEEAGDSVLRLRKSLYGLVPYCEVIGGLMYTSVATRPDLTVAISTLSQFLDNPGEVHWRR
jgi:Reverse transcriptase (RNA-dependent DNA polymerase)